MSIDRPMKINQPNNPSVSGPGHSAAAKPIQDPERSRGPAGALFSSDHVQLSNLSAHLSASSSDSPQRAAHLSSLAASVANGTYHVDASVVSGNIINDSLRFAAAGR